MAHVLLGVFVNILKYDGRNRRPRQATRPGGAPPGPGGAGG